MRLLRLIGALVFLLAVRPAQAQETVGRFGVRLGFALGNDFTTGGGTAHLEGFQIGGDLPLGKPVGRLGSLYFAPTIVFGGSNRQGPDTDGLLVRLLVNLKHPFPGTSFYAGFGLGYSFTEAHGSQFSNASGVATQYLIGYDFAKRPDQRWQPYLEISYHDGPDSKLRGFAFDLGLHF